MDRVPWGARRRRLAFSTWRPEPIEVLLRGIFARYAATGHLLYVTSEGTLMAVPFDQDRMEVAGEPVALEMASGFGPAVGRSTWRSPPPARSGMRPAGVGSAGTGEAVWVTREGAGDADSRSDRPAERPGALQGREAARDRHP